MKFGYTIIYVSNVETTLAFYEQAFKLKKLFLHESLQYGELDTGDTKLAFASEALAELNGVNIINNRNNTDKVPGFEIALIADDVSVAYQQALTAGAVAIKEPTLKPWGQTVAYVRDLNGVLVEICSQM